MLKNHGYAATFREKRLTRLDDLEAERDILRREVGELRRVINDIRKDLDSMRSKCDALERFASANGAATAAVKVERPNNRRHNGGPEPRHAGANQGEIPSGGRLFKRELVTMVHTAAVRRAYLTSVYNAIHT